MIGKNGGYSAGKHLTIADLSLIPQFLTVTTEELADYMHVRHWYSEITAKEMPYFDEINSKAVKSIEDRTRRLTERADNS
jgi:glutathione S-transferase